MANKMLKRDAGALEQGIVHLFASVAIGSTGAPTLSATKSKGMTSFTRTGVGAYTVTLSDVYQYLMGATFTFVKSSSTLAASSSIQAVVRADSTGTTGAFTLAFLDNAGAAIEVASGVTVLAHLTLKNSTV